MLTNAQLLLVTHLDFFEIFLCLVKLCLIVDLEPLSEILVGEVTFLTDPESLFKSHRLHILLVVHEHLIDHCLLRYR